MNTPETMRELLEAADELLTFEHDPVSGSFQVVPPPLDVHIAGEFVHKALAALNDAPEFAMPGRLIRGRLIADPREGV